MDSLELELDSLQVELDSLELEIWTPLNLKRGKYRADRILCPDCQKRSWETSRERYSSHVWPFFTFVWLSSIRDTASRPLPWGFLSPGSRVMGPCRSDLDASCQPRLISTCDFLAFKCGMY